MRVLRTKIAPNQTQNRASSNRNRRNFAPRMPVNSCKLHSNTALMPYIIFVASKNTSARVAHSQRACRAPKLCKNRRERVRFSCKYLRFFRAERSARPKICCASSQKHVQRPPAIIAHILRSMHASAAPKSRRIGSKIARLSTETTASRHQKCVQMPAKHTQKLR